MGLENGEKMAVRGEVIKRGGARGTAIMLSLLFFLVWADVAGAAPNAVVLTESNWRTGEIEVCYTGAVPGNVVQLWAKTWKDPDFEQVQSRIVVQATECWTSVPLENGQSIWYYVRTVDGLGDYADSYVFKQTPPITAYIINWPDIFADITGAMEDINASLTASIEAMVMPSSTSIDNLTASVENLKASIGVAQIETIGGQLGSGIDGLTEDMPGPAVVDDGVGTFTGGEGGPGLPTGTKGHDGGGISLTAPDPDSGTSNDATIRIPYGVDMGGNLLYLKLFTDEQLEKLKWIGLLYAIATATMWIFAAIAFVMHFVPKFKV